jgi:hypothetical protein
MNGQTFSNSGFSHVINAPTERSDIAEWRFSLPDAEDQRCWPEDHIAAGRRPQTIDDGCRSTPARSAKHSSSRGRTIFSEQSHLWSRREYRD